MSTPQEHEEREFRCDACGAEPGKTCRTMRHHPGRPRRAGYPTSSHASRFDKLRARKLAEKGLRLVPARIERIT